MWSGRVLSVLAKRSLEWKREKRQRRRRLANAYAHGREKRREKGRHDRKK